MNSANSVFRAWPRMLAVPRLGSLLASAGQSYDVVIIEGPPVVGIADAATLPDAARATMLVVQSVETWSVTARAAVTRLRATRAANVQGGRVAQFDAKAAG